MKNCIFIFFLLLFTTYTTAHSMTFSVYIPAETEGLLNTTSTKILENKLEAIVKAGGVFSGKGSRYIIVPKLAVIDESLSSSYPIHHVIKISITFCIGDGLSGRLYDTEILDYMGIGENRDQSIHCAINKIKPSASDLINLVSTAKKNILDYYNEIGPDIINNAKREAAGQRYENAISLLVSIPEECNFYNSAQEKALIYSEQILDRDNLMWLNKARSTWMTSHDEISMNKVSEYIGRIIVNNPDIQKKVNLLISDINKTMKELRKTQTEIQLKQIESETAIRVAKSQANAKIASSIADGASSILSNLIRLW